MAFVTTLLNGVQVGTSVSGQAFECGASEAVEVSKIESLPRDKGGEVRGNLYNFIKIVAKISDLSTAIAKLGDAIARSPNSVNVKNAKGSTPLHACGYLKRWDLAKVLLDSGADPTQRNQAGHSFFLTAVRDMDCPWETLFENFPELIERHQKFLAKSGSRQKSEKPAHRGELVPEGIKLEADKVLPNQNRENSRGLFLSYLEGQIDFDQIKERTFLDDAFLKPLINVGSMGKFLELLNAGHELSAGVRRHLAEQLLNSGGAMAFVGCEGLFPFLPVVLQKEVFSRLLAEKKVEMIECMAKSGASYGEDFIETCEEHGFYDLADFLIDWRDSQPAKNLSQEALAKPGVGRKKSQIKNQSKPRSQKPKNRRSGAGGRPKVAKIANLDGPQKEANEFEYRERSEPQKATVIIVKKARRIITDDGDALGGPSVAV